MISLFTFFLQYLTNFYFKKKTRKKYESIFTLKSDSKCIILRMVFILFYSSFISIFLNKVICKVFFSYLYFVKKKYKISILTKYNYCLFLRFCCC